MNTTKISIRKALASDWEVVWSLLSARGATDTEQAARDRFLSMINSLNHFIPIAIYDETIVGYAWAQDFGPHLRTGKKLIRFHDLFVLEDYRNKGIARQLFEAIKQWAEDGGANWLQWNANPSSASFYEKIGYTPIPEEQEGFPFFEIEFK